MTTFTIAIATQIVKILKARIIVLADQDTLATDLIANQKRLLLLLLPLQPRPPPADAEAAAAVYGVENWMIMSDQPRISTCRRRTLASFFVFLFLFLIVLLDALCKAVLAIFRSPNEKKKKKNVTFNSGSTADRCQECKPVFVPSAGKAPTYNVDLAVKSSAETHFQQICIFHDPHSRLVSETNWQMSFYFDFRLILKQLVQIDSMFSLKYFCRRNLSPKAFLDRKNGRKNSKRAPARFVSLMTTLRTLSDIYKYIRATRVHRPLWSTRDKIINLRYTRNQGIALKPG